jgi:hypothetical protein
MKWAIGAQSLETSRFIADANDCVAFEINPTESAWVPLGFAV